ncbi:MAG: DUF3658 domain-containing protein [Muribaculum sp.]|nr:DUF3658 domain-containing protein [Muribaculum sp.]
MKVLHIVSSYIASRDIYHGEVMVLPSWLLPFGRLFRDFTQNEIECYCSDVERLNPLYNPYPFAVCLLTLLKHDFSRYDKIVVWWRNDIYDHLFFLLICKIIPTQICEVKEGDEIERQYLQCRRDKTDTDNIIAKIPTVSSEAKIDNAKLWDELSKSDSNLRLLKNNQISSANIDCFDDVILRKIRRQGKLHYNDIAFKLSRTSLMSYYFGYRSEEFVKNRMMYLIHEGKLQPYILKKGNWLKSDYEEVLKIGERSKFKLSISRNVVLPAEERTLYLFPDKVAKRYKEELNNDDAIGNFPAWILPYCKLPNGFELKSWETYGKNVTDLLKLDEHQVVNSIRQFFDINFDKFDRIVVVHTNSVPGTLFSYMLSALINNENLYEIVIEDCSDNSSAEDYERSISTIFLPDKPSIISNEKRNELVVHWEHITSTPSELRVLDECGNIINVSIDYLDNLIIDYCNAKYKNTIQLTEAFVQSNPFGLKNCLLERFLLVRLAELARKGIVFPYVKNLKGNLCPIEIESMESSELRKICVLNKQIYITPSLFD